MCDIIIDVTTLLYYWLKIIKCVSLEDILSVNLIFMPTSFIDLLNSHSTYFVLVLFNLNHLVSKIYVHTSNLALTPSNFLSINTYNL